VNGGLAPQQWRGTRRRKVRPAAQDQTREEAQQEKGTKGRNGIACSRRGRKDAQLGTRMMAEGEEVPQEGRRGGTACERCCDSTAVSEQRLEACSGPVPGRLISPAAPIRRARRRENPRARPDVVGGGGAAPLCCCAAPYCRRGQLWSRQPRDGPPVFQSGPGPQRCCYF
jgi:hypothetical protein